MVVWLLSPGWLFATPWTVALQTTLSVGFSKQEYLSGLPFPSPGDLLDPGIEPVSPALQADSFPLGRKAPHTRLSWPASEEAQEVLCTCLASHPFGWKYSVSQGVNFGVAHPEPHQWHAWRSGPKALVFSMTTPSAWRQWRNAFKIPHGNNFMECLHYMWKLNNDSLEEQGFRKLTWYITFLKELLEYVLHENEGVDPQRGNIQTQRGPGIKGLNVDDGQKEAPAKRARRRPLTSKQLGSCPEKSQHGWWQMDGALSGNALRGQICDWWTAWCVKCQKNFF